MYRLNEAALNQHTDEHHDPPVARSYQEIAEVLTEREGRPISPAKVRALCRAAERKLARAAEADPVIDQWLQPHSATPSDRPAASAGVDQSRA